MSRPPTHFNEDANEPVIAVMLVTCLRIYITLNADSILFLVTSQTRCLIVRIVLFLYTNLIYLLVESFS